MGESVCITCGRPFTWKGMAPHLYCNRACYNKDARRARNLGKETSDETKGRMSLAARQRPPRPRLPDIKKTCEYCAQEFVVDRSLPLAAREAQRFCSQEHWYEWLRQHPEASPNWKGGKGPRRYGPNWLAQKELALIRDDHTCQRCHQKLPRPRLDVHHTRDPREFGSDYIAANDLTNLVTLCHSCHQLVERSGDCDFE